MIRIGDYIYGSTGGYNGSLLSAFNWETGQFAWKQPDYYMAQCLYKDDTLIFFRRGRHTLIRKNISGENNRIKNNAINRKSIKDITDTFFDRIVY